MAWAEVGLIGAVLPMALTRTGVVAAVVTLMAISADWSWRRRGRVVVVILLFVGALRVAIPGLIGTLTALFTKINEDDSTTARVGRYQIAGHYFWQHPWFGRGFNTLYPATHQVFDNWYLYTLTETGAVGLAVMFIFFFIVICTARGARLRATDPLTHEVGQALAGIGVAMMIMFATADMMSFTMIMGVFALMVGATGAFWRLTGGASSGLVPQTGPDRHHSPVGPRVERRLRLRSWVSPPPESSAGSGRGQGLRDGRDERPIRSRSGSVRWPAPPSSNRHRSGSGTGGRCRRPAPTTCPGWVSPTRTWGIEYSTVLLSSHSA